MEYAACWRSCTRFSRAWESHERLADPLPSRPGSIDEGESVVYSILLQGDSLRVRTRTEPADACAERGQLAGTWPVTALRSWGGVRGRGVWFPALVAVVMSTKVGYGV